MVTLTHPNLPERELTVPERSVHHYERSGWTRSETADKPLRRRHAEPEPETGPTE